LLCKKLDQHTLILWICRYQTSEECSASINIYIYLSMQKAVFQNSTLPNPVVTATKVFFPFSMDYNALMKTSPRSIEYAEKYK